jgi:bifunctional DNase/RNase
MREPLVLSPLVVVTLAREVETDRAGIILRTAEHDLELVLMIPAAEAARLAQVLGLTPCACAPLYGLVEELLTRADATLEQAILDGQPEGITARLRLRRDGHAEELACHPADAVALALRRYAPLMATPAALAHAHPVGPIDGDEPLRVWLSRVTPDDFDGPGQGSVGPRSEDE